MVSHAIHRSLLGHLFVRLEWHVYIDFWCFQALTNPVSGAVDFCVLILGNGTAYPYVFCKENIRNSCFVTAAPESVPNGFVRGHYFSQIQFTTIFFFVVYFTINLPSSLRHTNVSHSNINCIFICLRPVPYEGNHCGTVVKVLCYKSEGRWFDPSWCHWNFSLT